MRATAIATTLIAANLVEKTYKCPFCGNISKVTAPINEWLDSNDMLVQDAMPSLNEYQRETVITGMCMACMDKLFDVRE